MANNRDDDSMPANFILENVPLIDGPENAPNPTATPSLRPRNNIYNNSSPYPSMNYMKKRPYRTNSGNSTPVYSSIHQRYPGSKYQTPTLGPNEQQTPKKDRNFSSGSGQQHKPHVSNHSFDSNNSSQFNQSTPKSGTSEHSMSNYGPQTPVSSKKLDFSTSKYTQKENKLEYGSSSHHNSRSGMVFSKNPSTDNSSKSRQMKQLYDSPNFSDTNKTLKEQHRISTLGLGIKIPKNERGVDYSSETSSANTLKTPDSLIFENSPIKNPEDFPLVNFGSRRSNTSYKNSPVSLKKKSPNTEEQIPESLNSDNSDNANELLADVIDDVVDESDSDDNVQDSLEVTDDSNENHYSLSGELEFMNFDKSNSSFGINSDRSEEKSQLSNVSENMLVDGFMDGTINKRSKKDLEEDSYKALTANVSGFRSPVTEQEEVDANIDDILADDVLLENDEINPLSSDLKQSGSIRSTNAEKRGSLNHISLMPSSEADAALESKIKSLLMMKKSSIITKLEDSLSKSPLSNTSESKDSDDSQEIELEKSNDNVMSNNKADLYLDRFPNFLVASHMISSPQSPARTFISSASNTPNHLQVKSRNEKLEINTQIAMPPEKESKDDPDTPKKLSFHTRKDSDQLINWNVQDAAEWTSERVSFWLRMYGFNKVWVNTFERHQINHEKFVELTNDDMFSKFNTYLKLNNEYLDFGPAESNPKDAGSKDETLPQTPSSSSSRFRYLLKKTILDNYGDDSSISENVSLLVPKDDNSSLDLALPSSKDGKYIGVADDLKLLEKTKNLDILSVRHGRSNSDDINRLMNKAHSESPSQNLNAKFVAPLAIDDGNGLAKSQSNNSIGPFSPLSSGFSGNASTSSSDLAPTTGHAKNKRLSYIKRPFSVIEASKSKGGSTPASAKESPLSPYSSIFKRYTKNPEGSFISPTNMNFPQNSFSSLTGSTIASTQNGVNNDTIDFKLDSEKKGGFLKKKLRKNTRGASPVSPISSTSFDVGPGRTSKEIVGHIQLTNKQVPKPFPNKSSTYVLVSKNNETFVPVGSEKLKDLDSFKLSLTNALHLPENDINKLTFHMTDFESEWGEALNDATIQSLISFSFLNYEVKFYVNCENLPTIDLSHSNTRSTRSTKSSDTASFEIAADNKVNYPATPSSLINDGSYRASIKNQEEIDYLNFKGDNFDSQISPQNSNSLAVESANSKFASSISKPEITINFDKRRESSLVKNMIPQRPAPAPPASGLQRSSTVSKRLSKSPILNREPTMGSLHSGDSSENSSIYSKSSEKSFALEPGNETLRRSNTLLRRSSVKSLISRNSKIRNSGSGSTFEENKISFEGVPSLDEDSEESDGSEESDDNDFWAVAPIAKTEVSDTKSEISSIAESVSTATVTDNDNESKQSSLISEKPPKVIDNVKKEKDKWVVRPSTDLVYDNLEQFFPNTDLDKPIIYEVDTPPVSPLDRKDQSPFSPIKEGVTKSNVKVDKDPVKTRASTSDVDEVLMLPETTDVRRVSRNSRRKTIRGIAREYSIARKRESQTTEARKNSTLLRRQSTKLWGRKVVELTSTDMKYDYISKLKNNRGEMKQFAWIKGELIGIGTYGKVFLALNVTTGEMMAVKQVDIPRSGNVNKEMKDIIDALLVEVQTMKDLDHPNIVQYLGFEKVGSTYSLFLDYVAGGSVGSCLRLYGRFDDTLIRFLTRQVIDGLAYLHSKGILHRDLKADNLLLDLDGMCKITDFGISKRSENIYKNDSEMSMQGTIFWMAPEVIDNVVQNKKQGYSAKIDIWSLGCVVLEMFAGRRPWSNVEALSAMYRIGKTKLAPPIPDDIKPHVSGDGKEFLNRCFEIDPNRRPTASQLFQDCDFCIVDPSFDFENTKLAEIIKSNAKQNQYGKKSTSNIRR